MNTLYAQYIKWFTLICFFMIAFITGFSYYLNPYFVFGFNSDDSLIAYKSRISTRKGKSELMRHQSFDTLFLGTSRTEFGMYPDAVAGSVSFNGGLSGCSMTEAEGMLRVAIDSQSELKRVYLFCDLFSADIKKQVNPEMLVSRINPALSIPQYYIDSIFSSDSLKYSIRILEDLFKQEKTSRNSAGFLIKSHNVRYSVRSVFDHELYVHSGPGGRYTTLEYGKEALGPIRRIIQLCMEHDIELTLSIPPIHATLQNAMFTSGRWGTYEQFKLDLLEIVEAENSDVSLWDFSGISPYTAESLSPKDWLRADKSKWYVDCSHFKPLLSEEMFARIHGVSNEPFGARLQSDSIDEHLKLLRQELEQWRLEHRDEVEHLEALIQSDFFPKKIKPKP